MPTMAPEQVTCCECSRKFWVCSMEPGSKKRWCFRAQKAHFTKAGFIYCPICCADWSDYEEFSQEVLHDHCECVHKPQSLMAVPTSKAPPPPLPATSALAQALAISTLQPNSTPCYPQGSSQSNSLQPPPPPPRPSTTKAICMGSASQPNSYKAPPQPCPSFTMTISRIDFDNLEDRLARLERTVQGLAAAHDRLSVSHAHQQQLLMNRSQQQRPSPELPAGPTSSMPCTTPLENTNDPQQPHVASSMPSEPASFTPSNTASTTPFENDMQTQHRFARGTSNDEPM